MVGEKVTTTILMEKRLEGWWRGAEGSNASKREQMSVSACILESLRERVQSRLHLDLKKNEKNEHL